MSMMSSVKDAVLGRAMKLATDPRVAKLVSDPRLVGAAMKAINVGADLKSQATGITRVAAGALGFHTADEVAELRGTIQTLQDTIVGLENRIADADASLHAGKGQAGPDEAAPAAEGAPSGTGKGGKKKAAKS